MYMYNRSCVPSQSFKYSITAPNLSWWQMFQDHKESGVVYRKLGRSPCTVSLDWASDWSELWQWNLPDFDKSNKFEHGHVVCLARWNLNGVTLWLNLQCLHMCDGESFHSPLGYGRSDHQFTVVAPTLCPSPFLLTEKRSSDERALGANVAMMYSSLSICEEACGSVWIFHLRCEDS